MIKLSHMIPAICAVGLATAAPARAAVGWNEVITPQVQTTNCHTGVSEPLSQSAVAWFGDPAAPPTIGSAFYVRVKWSVTGNPCIGGAKVAPELFLPAGASLAISAANKVRCFATDVATGGSAEEIASCPQLAQVGVRGGLGFYPVGKPYVTWPTAQGKGWEIWVPILATSPLSGVVNSLDPLVACPSCVTAAVWSIDGNLSPWAFPRAGVKVVSGATIPLLTYPSPSATLITDTTARTFANLDRAGTTGSLFLEINTTPPSGATCTPSTNTLAIDASLPASVPLTVNWTGLDPGTTQYWRLCYVTGGVTYWGVTQSFRTTGVGKPRIVALSRTHGVPYTPITLSGTDLGGATVRFIGPLSTSTIPTLSVSASAITFAVPPLYAFEAPGTLEVTTPGGSATVPFTFGIDTLLDSVTVGNFDGGTALNDVRIQFHTTEPVPFWAADCIVDFSQLGSSCSSGLITYHDVPPGPHTAWITARAGGMFDGTQLVVSFTVVGSDTTPPETTLTVAPEAPYFLAPSTTVPFEFTSSEASPRFDCSLDGARWRTCESPLTYTGMSTGRHWFQVRARDGANNVDLTPASVSFTVAPSAVAITSGPPATTTERTATFQIFASNVVDFECRLDGGAWSRCRFPATYGGLGTGAHTFDVRGEDLAGEPSPTATWAWTIVP